MTWDDEIKEFEMYLKLEKGLAENSIEAYLNDITKLNYYVEQNHKNLPPQTVNSDILRNFIKYLSDFELSPKSQARTISGIRTFFKFLLIEEKIDNNPAHLLDLPKIGRKLPDILSIQDIEKILSAIDLSKPEGHRNKAIIETLYGCGLRVSELTTLKLTDLFFEDEFIRVLGKGNKERFVPIGRKALKEIKIYLNMHRNILKIDKKNENIVFLNRRGKKLTRVMIFTIVKNLAIKSELKKNISPHTFRHSFASHLVDGGADLRVVQDMLGHESITTTEIYTHLDMTYLRDTIMQFHPRNK